LGDRGCDDHRGAPALQGVWKEVDGLIAVAAHGKGRGVRSLVVLMRQSIVNHGASVPVCRTCAYSHQRNDLMETPAWLLSDDASARCWDGAVEAEGRKCQNIPCSEGRAGSTGMLVEEKW